MLLIQMAECCMVWVDAGERQTDDDAWKTCQYYFGDEDDGAMSEGWRLISITDDEAEDAQPGDEFWDEDQDRWFFVPGFW